MNELFSALSKTPDLFKLAENIFEREFNLSIEDYYLNPFDNCSIEIRYMLDKIKKKLVDAVIREVTKDYTLTINTSDIPEELMEDFDAVLLADYIKKQFLSRADEIAFEQILAKARELLPRRWDRDIEIDEIVQKNRLVLRCYLDWSYSVPILYYFCEKLTALERLTYVVLEGKKPSKTHQMAIAYKYQQCGTYEEILKRKEFYGPIKTTKIHKNGKLYVWFKSENDARRIAEVLLKKKAWTDLIAEHGNRCPAFRAGSSACKQ